ncbi:AMP-binding enzyme protein [Rutstroemia sp. NJR-2017a BVV2]|nr:AMP-binding enzyme protein [Rutstroemia sp. NJR-2017a BVV2]
MANTLPLPLPGVRHGERLSISILDERAQSEPQSPWVSMPIDDGDISKGFKDITYGQFANAVNHAAHWLVRHLPPSTEPFQSFAYAGPKDLRYPILAMAAGKVGKVVCYVPLMMFKTLSYPICSIPGGSMLKAILTLPYMKTDDSAFNNDDTRRTECNIYMRPESMASVVDHVARRREGLQIVAAPALEDLLQDKPAQQFRYQKSWEEARDNPWLVFHTSGTTGYPKPITYTHRMMAIVDVVAKLAGDEESNVHHYTFKRWYTPMPMVHFVGMLMFLSMTTFVHAVVVLGPPSLPSPETLIDILKFGRLDGALLVPSAIDTLCRDPSGLAALKSLQYIHYVGAPLGVNSGKKLASDVRVIPSIGSTEVGGYFTKLRHDTEDWDYVEFNKNVGAEFEPRPGNLHELVFVRKSEWAAMQQIFFLYPDRDRFETNDLWMEHPTRKGLWKIVGRTDDYIPLSHGDGLYASTVEQEIERHDLVQAALVGGHGKPKPMLLIEIVPGKHDEGLREEFIQSLLPYLEKVNAQCHKSVQLSPELVLLAQPEKPFVRTLKGSVARLPSLSLYEQETEGIYRNIL